MYVPEGIIGFILGVIATIVFAYIAVKKSN